MHSLHTVRPRSAQKSLKWLISAFRSKLQIEQDLNVNRVRYGATLQPRRDEIPKGTIGIRQSNIQDKYKYIEASPQERWFYPVSPLEDVPSYPSKKVYKITRSEDGLESLHVQNSASKLQGESDYFTVSPRWLRDHCTGMDSVNTNTGQRKINVLTGEIDCRICRIVPLHDGETLQVNFADGHTSIVDMAFIVDRHKPKRTADRLGMTPLQRWQAQDVAADPPSVPFEEMEASDVGLGKALSLLKRFGFCFVDSMPPTPEATEALLNRIGPIRNTHYGGFYDFTSDLSSKDTAYTAEALEPHTDTTYFTDPVGLQALHLISHTNGEGGLSSLVDGFKCAEILSQQSPNAYKVLSEIGVSGHASGNDGISIQPSDSLPTLVHSTLTGHLRQVRWNNADRCAIDIDLASVDQWYDAAEQWQKLISNPANQYWFQLKPGNMLLFDNWRVLHGRSEFTGKRRMCGGYINQDDWVSKLKNLTLKLEEVRGSTVQG